jgi:hypothetical protein
MRVALHQHVFCLGTVHEHWLLGFKYMEQVGRKLLTSANFNSTCSERDFDHCESD